MAMSTKERLDELGRYAAGNGLSEEFRVITIILGWYQKASITDPYLARDVAAAANMKFADDAIASLLELDAEHNFAKLK